MEENVVAEDTWHKVAGPNAFSTDGEGDRIHICIEGRYVSVIKHKNQIHCLDSVCFHAGGPIALGDMEEVNDVPCLICPWHYYRVSLTGEKYYQSAEPGTDGKYHAGEWKTIGKRQRTHLAEQRPDGIYVKLNLEGTLASDEYACKTECGHRVKTGASRLTGLALNDKDSGRTSPPGSGSPRSASPAARGPMDSPRASPRISRLAEGEDVWPADLVADTGRNHIGGGNSNMHMSPSRRYRSRSPSPRIR